MGQIRSGRAVSFDQVLASLENLIWPVQCAGCAKWDTQLCQACFSLARKEPSEQVLDNEEGVPTWSLLSLGHYEGALRDMVLTAKHSPGTDLSRFLHTCGLNLGRAAAFQMDEALQLKLGVITRVWVVPTPSSHKRRRQRAEIVPIIAQGVACGMRDAFVLELNVVVPVRVFRAVRLRRLRRGQARMSARSRESGRIGSMEQIAKVPHGTVIVVVDDVVTTGATLREMFRVLDPHVFGAVALVSTEK